MNRISADSFRTLCHQRGLAVTHQRSIIFEAMAAVSGHPSPEEVYNKVRRKIPSISLATVYKNLHQFVEAGILKEVSPHHGSVRVELNHEAHHHLVCTVCHSIADVSQEELEPVRLRKGAAPAFRVQSYSVDVLGVCATCQQKQSNSKPQRRARS
jgi:Fur family transcriptional regulator, peroxide stress response regulator